MILAGKQVTVLGGGNTAFSMAANLALAGFEVLLWEHPEFAQTIEPIRESLTIHLDGAGATGAARLAGVTTDPAEALAWSETSRLLGSVVCPRAVSGAAPAAPETRTSPRSPARESRRPGRRQRVAGSGHRRRDRRGIRYSAIRLSQERPGPGRDLGHRHRTRHRRRASFSDRRGDASLAGAVPRSGRLWQCVGSRSLGAEPSRPSARCA